MPLSLFEGIDKRALALFRIGLGLLILFDLFQRLPFVPLMYSDEGLVPRDLVLSQSKFPPWGVHFLSGEVGWTYFLLLVSAFFAVLLILGYKTRCASVATWFLLTSLQYRNPHFLFGAHNLLRNLSFWAMFVPLDKVWSIKKKEADSKTTFTSLGTLCLLAQPLILYFFTGLEKTGESWWKGTAVWLALNSEILTTSLGFKLGHYFSLTKALTYFTLALEILGPFILLFPRKYSKLRISILGLFLALQIGILLTLKVGFFPLVSTLALVPYIPFRSLALARPLSISIKRDWAPAFCLFLSLFFTVSTTRNDKPEFHPLVQRLLWLTHLDHRWHMFAPDVAPSADWLAIEARYANGRSYNANGKDYFSSSLFYKYLGTLSKTKHRENRRFLAEYFCKKEEGVVENGLLAEVDLYTVSKKLDSTSLSYGEPNRILLWSHRCN